MHLCNNLKYDNVCVSYPLNNCKWHLLAQHIPYIGTVDNCLQCQYKECAESTSAIGLL